MSFGSNLRKARETRTDLSQKDAAAAMGINNSNLNRYESDSSEPDIETIKKMALHNMLSINQYLNKMIENHINEGRKNDITNRRNDAAKATKISQ